MLPYFEIIASVVVALVVVFVTPLGEWIVKRRWMSPPTFGLESHEADRSAEIFVHAMNRQARQKRPLGLYVEGILISRIGTLISSGDRHVWRINLKDSRIPRSLYTEKIKLSLRFFFDPDTLSNEMPLFIGEHFEETIMKDSENPIVTVNTAKEFLLNLGSYRELLIAAGSYRITDALQISGQYARWRDVFDGKELEVPNARRLTIRGIGACQVLTEVKYAWVLLFKYASELKLNEIVLGHEPGGHCRGGVLGLVESNYVAVKDSILFGSGTYGFEFVDSSNISLDDCSVKDCTYGIGKIINSTDVVFTRVSFFNNEDFSLIEVHGECGTIIFENCEFCNNRSRIEPKYIHTYFVEFINTTGTGSKVIFRDCTFSENVANQFTNVSDRIQLHGCKFRDNSFPTP